MVKNVNPKAGSVDQMFAWGITPHCETSHDGMKKVYAEIAESFRLVQSNEKGRYVALPNTKRRRINGYGDALSIRNFSCLSYNITRQLTQLRNNEYILPLLESLKQMSMQSDYLHETRFHCQDCIWKIRYGCFLQAFQCHLQ